VLDERFTKLISGFDNSFKLIRRGAKAEVPCDWGLDLTDGPQALLPGLAKAKNVAQAARLRTIWHLQNGRPDQARDDLLAAFVLGRNLSRDRVLISAMVQLAIENLVASTIAETFYQFPPETLRQLADGLETAPPRGLVAECLGTENTSFCQYFTRKIESFHAEETQESRVLDRIRALLGSSFGAEAGGDAASKAENIIRAAGGTSEGILKLLREMAPLYDRAAEILQLPAGEYDKAMAEFDVSMKTNVNPLVQEFFPSFDKARKKEFATQINVAMVRAGIEHKLRGADGLASVPDPCTGVPFDLDHFVFEGVDRGFRLRSKYHPRDFDEVLIFVEKPGPAFRTNGKQAGEKVN